ncbi:methylcrotonyl-CoA carboxylase [Naegleria gruberi]|uniref:Methylcrotonyl-CoA carboxylase n=1 Tax=Naegleria gruberi TaxID=5762 RepID=D2VDR3_NAEGR|nr:methylcrotonyl-CoA carboxylase [Naegleria gruberi]EFC45045.1 methylcrotonyl-CoA carboxylase [Naegleria gruberi]|eukprot:XP_002677789.1 methylcrotonyl-CoA carboxylase [Naegleria gruberi strain NEG-M]
MRKEIFSYNYESTTHITIIISSRLCNEQNKKPLFDKILIANRGEIACRVMKTARKLGIKTVAVYSEADANSMHVAMADEAYLLGPPESSKSYLCGDKILEIAKQCGAQAIHPGYGFLSENAKFASLCAKNGVVFIGPPEGAIISMGSKSESKKIMEHAKVPVVPGYHGDEQGEDKLLEEAKKIGFPILIKAVLGGGGKGMKLAHSEKEFKEALSSAKREAKASFGDDRVLIEKYIQTPRHIEIQVFADTHGNCVYLFERDCSVQRRHQKIIEEAPAPGLADEVRRAMGESAVDAARAVGYVGAGTVEFIMDNADNSYYFMEMNTRLQVEHPVTEMITGQDLVEWQLQVASGNRLPLLQNELKRTGHAFEARIYAENPENNFLPGTGTLRYLSPPEEIPGEVRVETGVRQGDEVSIYYDPMIAKLVVWGENRELALRKLVSCLHRYHISGLNTNIEFLIRLATNERFKNVTELETHFIQKYYSELFPEKKIDDSVFLLSTLSLIVKNDRQTKRSSDPFDQLKGLRFNHNHDENFEFHHPHHKDQIVSVNVEHVWDPQTTSKFVMKIGKNSHVVSGSYDATTKEIVASVDGRKFHSTLAFSHDQKTIYLFTRDGQRYEIVPVLAAFEQKGGPAMGSLKSPMPGKITAVMVKEGDKVSKGDTILAMEAMKMEHKILATKDGVIKSLPYAIGDLVQGEAVLAVLE